MRHIAIVVALIAALGACGDATPSSTTRRTTVPDAVTSTTPTEGFTMTLLPEFVQGVIPGAATGVLVRIDSTDPTPVALTASADGATVTVSPAAIGPDRVAEVTVVADPASVERPIEIVVTATRGDITLTDSRSTTVMTWEDDRGDDADALLAIFVEWLAAERPELGIGPDTGFTGSLSAPGLLVVNHYLYLSDEWEVGLSWHIMIPPDDWAEIYLRPRGEPAPVAAFRLSSQAAARDGVIEIAEVTPPAEVVR